MIMKEQTDYTFYFVYLYKDSSLLIEFLFIFVRGRLKLLNLKFKRRLLSHVTKDSLIYHIFALNSTV